MSDLYTIICGDSLEKLKDVPDGSIQLTVTSPPYDNLRTYGGFTWDFEGIAKELYRVTCSGGVCCWNVNDSVVDGSETLTSAKQKIFFRECGFNVHDTMIWEKPSVASPDDSRYDNLFEYVFVFSKGRPATFNPIKDRKNVYGGMPRFGVGSRRLANGEMQSTSPVIVAEFGKRSNIWRGNTAAQDSPCSKILHPATMPSWLAHDLIISWSNPGDTVLDTFLGSGTTGKEALGTGRKFIGFDINPDYCELARKTCSQATQGFALA